MFDKSYATHTVGLQLEDQRIKGAQLYLSKGQPALEKLFEVDNTSQQILNEHVNPLYINNSNNWRASLNSNLIVTTLSSQEVLVRPLDVKLKKTKDIDAVLAFQAEPLLPYPVENAILNSITLNQTSEGTQLSLVAARRDHIQTHLNVWNELSIEPEVVTAVPVALAHFSKFFCPSSKIIFVVYLGHSETSCIIVQEGKLVAAQSSQQGLNGLQNAFEKDLATQIKERNTLPAFNQLDFNAIDKKKFPQLYIALDSWKRDITRLLYAIEKQSRAHEISEIFLTGEGAVHTNLGAVLCQGLQKQLVEPIATPLFPASTAQLQQFAVPIGSAICALPLSKEQVNFRQQEFAYPNPWKRLKKPLMLYGILCIALTVSIYLFGQSYLGYKQDQLRQSYADVLATMNKSYQAVEQEYAAKNPSNRNEEGLPAITTLTAEDIQNRIAFLQKNVKDTAATFPLQPNIPRVSDVLAWLSTHPKVTGKGSVDGDAEPSSLQIDNFAYTLVKRPEIKKPQEKYQVKIELEFSSPSPKLAREFHDALIAPNDIVDPKGEVKWSSNRGKYRTSFFLKDKTIYSGG